MKGDFTRFTFDRTKHYRGVAMQQGRVQLDADWNENLSISAHHLQTLTRDVIGECGVPVHVDAFKIEAPAVDLSSAPFDFKIDAGPTGQGRMYVSGLLCEIENDTTYLTQPDWLPAPSGTTLADLGPVLPELKNGETRVDLAYLDVWPRTINAVEDPHIREIALGGPDTAERIKTVWQVKVKPGVGRDFTCSTPLGLPAAGGGTLQVVVANTTTLPDPCEPTAQGGYSGPDNRLYRVEVHQGGPLNTATFKWSRDNGSVIASVELFKSATEVVVRNLGRDDYLKFKTGDFVEISDDATTLSGLPGILSRITVDEASRTLTLDTALPDAIWKATGRHPLVRRWDGGDQQVIDGTVQPLEAGLQVQFAATANDFRTGDYWTFAARLVDRSIDPALAAPVPPMGVQHEYCSLALITWTRQDNNVTAAVQDCRLLFPPLTEIKSGEGCCVVSVGDGISSHGDFTDIQAAVDSLKNGGQVCILPGEYRLSAPVHISAGQIVISGCGGQAQLFAPEEAPAFIVEKAVAFQLEGLWIQGFNPTGIVIIDSCVLVNIVGCDITNYQTIDQRGNTRLNFLLARDMVINAAGGIGPAIFVKESTVVYITGNVLIGIPAVSLQANISRVVDNQLSAGGVWLRDGSNEAIIRENEIGGGYGSGIILGGLGPGEEPSPSFFGVQDIKIVNNEISGMYSGITTLPTSPDQIKNAGITSDVTIFGNRITGCQQTGENVPLTESVAAGGIILTFVRQVRILNNEIANNGSLKGITASGIYIFACEGLEVSDNTIIFNGTEILDPNLQCIDFSQAQTGQNPRTEQGATFSIFDAQHNLVPSSQIVQIGNTMALDLQVSTEINLDAPARTVQLVLTSRPAGGTIEIFDSNNASVGIYNIPSGLQQEPVTISGPSISRVVVVTNGGGTFLHKFCFSGMPTSFQAGIAALYVTGFGGLLGSAPSNLTHQAGFALLESSAARIQNNEVICPIGHALVLLAAGPLSIHGNAFATHGFFDQPYMTRDFEGPPVQGIDFNRLLGMTGSICIDNIGQVLDTSKTFFGLASNTRLRYFGSPNIRALAQTNLPDGRLLFHDNQLAFLDPNSNDTKAPVERFSAILSTLGDMSIQDNQVRLVNPGERLSIDVGALGATIRASGNRFEELPGSVTCSYASVATSLNTTTNNQSTNCLCTSVQTVPTGGNLNYIEAQNLTIMPCK